MQRFFLPRYDFMKYRGEECRENCFGCCSCCSMMSHRVTESPTFSFQWELGSAYIYSANATDSIFHSVTVDFWALSRFTVLEAVITSLLVDSISIAALTKIATIWAVFNFSYTSAFFSAVFLLNVPFVFFFKCECEVSELVCRSINFCFQINHLRIQVNVYLHFFYRFWFPLDNSHPFWRGPEMHVYRTREQAQICRVKHSSKFLKKLQKSRLGWS